MNVTDQSVEKFMGGIAMISKFSVKKPYTVLVAIVLIIVLGIVSFTKMTTDLLPSMELPYAVIITTYIGASPEEVEQTVTAPIEEAMATINNIKNITSSSSENYSMVVLEFNTDANMDAATIDMRESLDQISSYWDDSISSPIIMKLNPDMMPVMVAAVDVDGMDAIELTQYVEDEIAPNLEALNGVASVTVIGDVTESVKITISQEKIDALNEDIIASLDSTFAEAEDQIESASSQITSGRNQLSSKKEATQSQLSTAEIGLSDAKLELLQTEMELTDALEELLNQEKTLIENETALNGQKQTLEGAITQLETAYGQYQALIAQKEALETMGDTTSASYQAVVAAISQIESKVGEQQDENGNPLTIASIPSYVATMQAGLQEIEQGLAQIAAGKAVIAENKQKINDGLVSVSDGKVTINDKLAEIYAANAAAQSGFIQAENQLNEGEASLEAAKEELNTQKDTAYESADMNGIITESMIKTLLTAQNFSMPAGYVTEDGEDYLIRVGDKFDSIEALSDFILMDMGMEGVEPIKLSDVADIEVVDNSDETYTKVNGNSGIILSVSKQNDFSTADVADRLNEKFEDLMEENEGLHFSTLMDQGVYINLIIDSVLENLAFGAILAVLILLLFLKDIRPTGIIACSIPVSVIFAIVMMYFSGVTLNVISLSGLALGVGMLVDNSIVVIENIYRLRSEGKSVKEAAILGAKQVTGAIIASTATTVVVFVPIIFTSGLTKQLFVDMALTIAYSLLASLIIAITFVPMMASKVLKKEMKKEGKFFEKLQGAYEKSLDKVLKHKGLVILFVLAAFILSTVAAISQGTSLMPDMDSTQLTMTMTMPEGTVELADTAAMADEIIERVTEIEDVETVGAMVGGSTMAMLGLGSSDAVDSVSFYIQCYDDKKMSNEEIASLIEEKTADLECEISVSASTMDLSALGASGVVIEIKGKEIDSLQEIANDIAEKLEEVEGLTEISNGQDETTPELRISVNKDEAIAYGLTVGQVYQAVYSEIAASTKAMTLSTAEKDYDVYVEDEEKQTLTLEDIKNITIEGTVNGEAKEVKVSEIAEITEADGLSAITRDNQSRYIEVSAAVESGYNTGLVSNDVEKLLEDYEFPEGYSLEYNGENETVMEAMKQVGLMMLLAVIFMYLVMVIQFQSLLSPFIIMFTIPLAFTGGFIGLLIGGMDVSVIAMIGMVMLAGIIVNNGIVLVDSINQMREEGMCKREAIILSGKTRLRPIIMTALTTILGLSTMAMGLGMGADMAQPMAVVVIGGLIYGTLLTLYVVPCIYDIFNRKEKIVAEVETAEEDV